MRVVRDWEPPLQPVHLHETLAPPGAQGHRVRGQEGLWS